MKNTLNNAKSAIGRIGGIAGQVANKAVNYAQSQIPKKNISKSFSRPIKEKGFGSDLMRREGRRMGDIKKTSEPMRRPIKDMPLNLQRRALQGRQPKV